MKLVLPQPCRDDNIQRAKAILVPLSLLITFIAAVTGLFDGLTHIVVGLGSGSTYPYCSPNGQIQYLSLTNDYHDLWDPSLFLSVTLGFGRFSFAEAKIIDVAFDLIVGRCSQLLLAFAVYPILRRSFLRSMEVSGISIQVVFPFFLQQIGTGSLWALLQHTTTGYRKTTRKQLAIERPSRRFDWRLILIFFIVLYVLVTPTILSAATSYQAQSTPFVQLPSIGDYVEATDLVVPDLVIYDGDRIGLIENFPVIKNSDIFNTTNGYLEDINTIGSLFFKYSETYYHWLKSHPAAGSNVSLCPTLTTLPKYQTVNGTGYPPQWSLTLHTSILGAETTCDCLEELNACTTSTFTVEGKTWNLTAPPLTVNYGNDSCDGTTCYVDGNRTFGYDYVLKNGVCQPTNVYQWGFSSLVLFAFCMLTCFVAVLLLVLHFDAWWNSQADRYQQSINMYRDVLDLSEELRAEYDEDVCSKRADDLKKEIKHRPVRIELDTADLLPSRSQPFYDNLRRRLRPSWDEIVVDFKKCKDYYSETRVAKMGFSLNRR